MNAGSDPNPSNNSPNSAPSRYFCPGEAAAISEAVHLSRLSTFFHKCQLCEHRQEIERLAPSIQTQWAQLSTSTEPVRIFQANGIRGRYLNRITRNEATQIAAVFASTLREVVEFWKSQRQLPPAGRWLRVAFGHDSRPSSPDLAIAAATSLRQHGCELIDLGMSLRPHLEAVIREQGVDGAFFVTGQGAPAGWNGFELIGPDGVIWSQSGMLEIVEQRFHEHCRRPERQAAPISPCNSVLAAIERLQPSLHGFRPLTFGIDTTEPVLREVLCRSQREWPGTLVLETTAHADLRFEIAEDGITCRIFDEQLQEVSAERILHGLGELLLEEHPHVDVIVSDEGLARLGWTVQRCGPGYLVAHPGGQTQESLLRTMRSMAAPLATDGAGRFWVRRGAQIVGDALQTITLVLRSLSRSDRLMSQWGRETPAA